VEKNKREEIREGERATEKISAASDSAEQKKQISTKPKKMSSKEKASMGLRFQQAVTLDDFLDGYNTKVNLAPKRRSDFRARGRKEKLGRSADSSGSKVGARGESTLKGLVKGVGAAGSSNASGRACRSLGFLFCSRREPSLMLSVFFYW